MSKIQSFNLWLGLFVVLLSALLLSQVLLVSAQSTTDTGEIIIAPPAEGGSAVVNEEYQVENTNPPNGDPVVTLGGQVAKTKDSDGTGQQVAAFAFGVAHSEVSFTGSIDTVSSFLAKKWAKDGAVPADVELLCLTNDGAWTSSNVEATVNITAGANGSFTYSVSGDVNQHGTCAVFFASSASDNGGGQPNRNVNSLGING